MRLPDIKNVFEIVYRYRSKSIGMREFYLEGEELKKYLNQISGASVMAITHGTEFEPLKWKVRKGKEK